MPPTAGVAGEEKGGGPAEQQGVSVQMGHVTCRSRGLASRLGLQVGPPWVEGGRGESSEAKGARIGFLFPFLW